MLTGNPGHLRTFDYTGLHRYFLTFCTNNRQQLFTDRTSVDLVLRQILRAADDEGFAIVAYCFMPNHLHLLIEAKSDSSNCLRFITRAKQFSGFYYSKAYGKRLWQRYGYERTLRDDDVTLVVARYILENPVRAKVVANPNEYPFSGSTTHSLDEILAAVGEYSWSG
jgi:REP-associated tyrosine transposase